MNKSYIAIALVVNFLLVASVEASSMVSNEGSALSGMAAGIGIFTKVNGGPPIASWSQIRQVFNLDAANRMLRDEASAGYPLEDHYEFITQTVPYTGYEGSRILLVRTIPLQRAEDKLKYRYIIGTSRDGTTTSLRVPEEQVRAMFQNAGVPLPTPKPGLPTVEVEAMPSAAEIYAQAIPAADTSPLPSTVNMITSTPTPALAPTSAPAAERSSAGAEEKPSAPSFPIVPVAILALAIVGVIVVLLRRKSP